MKYISIDQLEQFDFHDSDWRLESREGDTLTFAVGHLNIHKDTEQNDEDYDMELGPARVTVRGFRLIRFEQEGRGTAAQPRALCPGESFQVRYLTREGDCWELGGCGLVPFFEAAFGFDSVKIAWDAYVNKAWYELHRYYTFPVVLDTPAGPVSETLEITVHEEEVYRVGHGWIPAPSVSARVCLGEEMYLGDGTDDYLWIDAVADLQKKLPAGVTIRGCLTCRHGNLCPYGNEPGAVFCLRGTPLSGKMDVATLCDNHAVWIERRKAYFDCCDHWAETADDFFTYNDYHIFLKN